MRAGKGNSPPFAQVCHNAFNRIGVYTSLVFIDQITERMLELLMSVRTELILLRISSIDPCDVKKGRFFFLFGVDMTSFTSH